MKIDILMSKLINKILHFSKLKHLYYFFYYSYIKHGYKDLDRIIKVLNDKRFFLITSTGRIGTTLFSQMLNNINGTYVVHEPLFQETKYHRLAMEDPNFSRTFLEEFRLKEIFSRLEKNDCKRYGEVNGGLRRNIKELKGLIPNMKIIHIVRNGKDTISSILNRNTLLKGDVYYNFKPSNSIVNEKKWSNFTRFEKITFLWSAENKYMRENSDITVRFEDLISDYKYFKKYILDILDLELDYQVWKKFIRSKINANKNIKVSNKFDEWSNNQKEFFYFYCSDEMKIYDYRL